MNKALFVSLLLPSCLLFAQPTQAATCSDFATQQEAQAYFNRTRDGRLDPPLYSRREKMVAKAEKLAS